MSRPEKTSDEARNQYKTSDDDGILTSLEDMCFKITPRVSRKNLILMGFISYCKQNRSKIDHLPNAVRKNFLDILNEASLLVGKKNMRKMSHYMYGLRNVRNRVIDYIVGGSVDDETIHEYIQTACEGHAFNRFNEDGWKKLSIMKKDDISKLRKIVKSMVTNERMNPSQIKSIEFDDIINRSPKKFGYGDVIDIPKPVRDPKTKKIISVK